MQRPGKNFQKSGIHKNALMQRSIWYMKRKRIMPGLRLIGIFLKCAVSARGPVRRSYGCRNNVRGPSRRRRSLVCRRSTTASLSYEISRRHGIGSVNSTHFGGSRTGSAAIGNKGAESACGSSGGPVLGGAGEREPHGADEAAAAEVGPAAVGERAAVGLEE